MSHLGDHLPAREQVNNELAKSMRGIMTIRIATWNLDHAYKNNSRKIEAQIGKIKGICADIWVLTETCSQVDLSSLGYSQVNSDKNGYKKYCSTIWSRLPIRKTIKTYDCETAVCAEIQITPQINIIVYGTIITYQMDGVAGGKSKPWEEHRKAIVDQGADWAKIIADNGNSIFCIAGDFNQARDGSDWYFAQTTNKQGIADLTNQLVLNDLSCLTDDDFFKSKKLEYRHNVDHICIATKYQQNCKKVAVWYEPELTDHNGVYVELQL